MQKQTNDLALIASGMHMPLTDATWAVATGIAFAALYICDPHVSSLLFCNRLEVTYCQWSGLDLYCRCGSLVTYTVQFTPHCCLLMTLDLCSWLTVLIASAEFAIPQDP